MHDHDYYIELIHKIKVSIILKRSLKQNSKENYNISDLPVNENIEESIKNYIKDTSRIIEDIIDFINSPDGLDGSTIFNVCIYNLF